MNKEINSSSYTKLDTDSLKNNNFNQADLPNIITGSRKRVQPIPQEFKISYSDRNQGLLLRSAR